MNEINFIRNLLKKNVLILELINTTHNKAKRNLVTSRLRKAKKYYYNTFFEENKNNVKDTWKCIRNLINVSKKAITNIDKIVENGKETTNPVEKADALNTFYVNIGKAVDQKIPKGTTPFSNYLRNRNTFNITLNPCTHDEVIKYISDILSVSKASGPNSIPIPILKSNIDQLIEPITSMLNKSLAEGTFPDLLKLASVCQINKNNDRIKCGNYRPIPLLSNLSKIF